MSTQLEIAQIVGIISASYPNFNPAKETVGVYYELLKDLPLDTLRIATLQCCAESGRKFAPSVGEIRGAVGEIQRKAAGIPSALDAWNEVCNAPKPSEYRTMRNGEWIDPPVYQWSHPLVEKIAKQFGWPHFPKFENEGVDRAHFLKHYELAYQENASAMIELPEVTKYVEAGAEIKRISDGMRK